MMDTSPQEALGAADSFDHMPDAVFQLINVKRCCVCELLLGLCPDVFVRIDFESVSRKSMDINFRMAAQKGNHFDSGNIIPMKLRIQSQVVVSRRHDDARNNRNAITPVTVPQNWRFSDRCPCSSDGRNKQEAAFVKECQICMMLPSVFLYAARHNVSNARGPLRRAVWRVVLASEHSNVNRFLVIARRPTRNNSRKSFSPRPRRFVSTSTIRWDIPQPARLASADCQVEPVAGCPIGKADRVLDGTPSHDSRHGDSFDPIERRSLTRRQAAWLHCEMYNHAATIRWLAAAVVALILLNFHVVSWMKL